MSAGVWLASWKSPALVPPSRAVGLLLTLPVLRTVTVWAAVGVPTTASPKGNADGEASSSGCGGGGGVEPVPLRPTLTSAPPEPATSSDASRVPVPPGLKNTDTVHVAAGARVAPAQVPPARGNSAARRWRGNSLDL